MAATIGTRTDAGMAFPEAGTWVFDTDHTRVGFAGRHLMVSAVRGTFTRFAGAVHVAAVPEETTAELIVEAASLASGSADRDEHLKSADFFDVARYPEVTLYATSLRHVAGERWAATGDLTIRGVTRPVEIAIAFNGVVTDPWGSRKLGLSATAEIDREAWGLTWNMALEAGGVVVGRKIRIEVDVEAVRQ